ncbi:MAG: hypothetical protein JO199_07765 [Candidatus Eremiobacteraeota bacterium]|nr:hypothetical protein [Candidatus Eremiobacteraeota bacterium]
MTLPSCAACGAIVLLLLSNVAAAPAPDGAVVIAAAYGRNEALRDYTFRMDVAMAMHHFPWLRFHLDGNGTYERGEKYSVHFTGGPPFIASKIHDVDLSMIDPTMWPGKYRYIEAGQQGADTIFSLAAVDDATLQSATVALSPTCGAQWVDATYTDGMHVHMDVVSNDRLGYLLPESIDATVDYPHMPMSADARFTAYDLPH